jgi:hypothetical protein
MDNSQEGQGYVNSDLEDVDFNLVTDSLQSTADEIDHFFTQIISDSPDSSE